MTPSSPSSLPVVSVALVLPEHLEKIRVGVAIGLALALAITGVVDVYLIANYGGEASITALVHEVSRKYPAIPLAAGLLIGHLFL